MLFDTALNSSNSSGAAAVSVVAGMLVMLGFELVSPSTLVETEPSASELDADV